MTKDKLEKATDLECKIICLEKAEDRLKTDDILIGDRAFGSPNLSYLLPEEQNKKLKAYILKMIRAEKRAAEEEFKKL